MDVKTPNILKIDKDLEEISEINFGKSKLGVIKTPGHTPGSVCLYSIKDNFCQKNNIKL